MSAPTVSVAGFAALYPPYGATASAGIVGWIEQSENRRFRQIRHMYRYHPGGAA